MDNFILAYYQGIMNGSIVVGRWIRLLYERIVNGIESGEWIFDQKKANNAIRFIERFAHHNKGKLAPGRLELSLWQKAAISIIFGIVDADGKRHFREICWTVGRKCGKSLIASGIMEFMAFADGEFGAELFCIAPKLEQADLVHSAFKFSVEQEPTLSKRMVPRKYDLYIKETNTTIKKIAFNEKKADGFNPHCVVGDEFSSWPGERGLKQYEVMVSGMGAREQPIMLMISSGGYENEGIYDELVKRGTSFLLGNSKESRLLPILYMIDDLTRWDDLNEIRKSCPGLGVSVGTGWMLDQINVAYESLSKKAEFLTKMCCVKQNSSQAWLNAEWVEKSCGKQLTLEDMRGSYCVGGIDLSMTTDLTCACIVVEKDGQLHVFSRFYLPANRMHDAEARDGLPYSLYAQKGMITPSGENTVDTMDCFAWFRQLIEDYQIYPLAVGYDHYMALPLVQAMKAYGFRMSDVRQGDNLTPVINEVEGLFADGRFDIGENALLKVHLLDSALKVNAESNRRQLVKLNRKCHIDGMAALLDAMCVRQCFHDEIGEQLRNEVS